MSVQNIRLPAGQVLAVVADTAASLVRLRESGEPYSPAAIAAGDSLSVGPFGDPRLYAIYSDLPASYSFSSPDPLSTGDTLASAVLTAPAISGATEFGLADDIVTLHGADAPVDYTDGDPAATGEGVAGPGSVYIRTSNGKHYTNGGTKAQPVWKLITSAA